MLFGVLTFLQGRFLILVTLFFIQVAYISVNVQEKARDEYKKICSNGGIQLGVT